MTDAGGAFSIGTGGTPQQRYGIALLLSLTALASWHLGIHRVGLSPFFLYLAAVTIASGIGGIGPGLVVIAFGTIAGNFAYSFPGDFVLRGSQGPLQLALFLLASAAITLLQYERLRLIEAERTSRLRAERLRAEQAAMMEQMTEAVLVADPEGRVLYLNEAARDLYAAPAMNGMPVQRMAGWLRIYRPDGTEVTADDFALALAAQGETLTNVERIIERPDGSRVTVVAHARQVRGPDGGVLGAIATIRDVTHERELERERELLLSAMIHDLKSPLATIKGMSQLIHRRLLRTRELPDESRAEFLEGLESIDQKVSEMARLIDDVVESGRRTVVPNLQEHDLVGMVRSIAEEIDRSEPQHSIQVETNLTGLIGEWDGDRLERALENLVRNAVKYSPDGGPVYICIARDAQGQAVITVKDHGIGIPQHDQARIFERFFRAGNATQIASGTGIGLAAARQTVEIHGGTIEIESVEGQGTSVRVHLPVRQV